MVKFFSVLCSKQRDKSAALSELMAVLSEFLAFAEGGGGCGGGVSLIFHWFSSLAMARKLSLDCAFFFWDCSVSFWSRASGELPQTAQWAWHAGPEPWRD